MTDLPAHWHLRHQDGRVIGPLTLNALRDWAAQARDTTGTEVSADGLHWMPPYAVPALELDWMLEDPQAKGLGPLHKQAIGAMLRDQMVAQTAAVTHIYTRARSTVAELVADQERTPAPSPSDGGNRRPRADTEAQLTALRELIASLTAENTRLASERQASEATAGRAGRRNPATDGLPRAATTTARPADGAAQGVTGGTGAAPRRPQPTPTAVHTTHRLCPQCKHPSATRLSRPLWMRIIPNSRRLVCDRCGTEFLALARNIKATPQASAPPADEENA